MAKDHLILLHGAIGSKTDLEEVKILLKDDFDVHSFNFEGHGGRPSTNRFTIDLFSKNVLDYMNKNGISKTHFFGYSMGGYVALNLALKFSEKVNKIICFGTKFNWTEESAKNEVKKLNPSIIDVKVPSFAKYLAELHHPCDWKKVLSKTANMMLSLGNGDSLKNTDFESIDHEVLICLGSNDNMVSKEESENVVNAMRNGNFKLIEEFYHPLNKNDLKLMAEIIEDFIWE